MFEVLSLMFYVKFPFINW